ARNFSREDALARWLEWHPSRSHLGCQPHQTYCFATWRKKPQPLTGRGKLAERNETSSSALPALQHLLGDLGPNIPWSLCLRFGFCLSKKFARRSQGTKTFDLNQNFEPRARNRRPTIDVGGCEDAHKGAAAALATLCC